MDEAQVLDMLHKKVAAAGSQKVVAKELGVSQSYLHDMLSGRRGVGEGKLLEALGIERVVTFRKKGKTNA